MKENIFDVETFFEALSIASSMNRELYFMSQFIDGMKKQGSGADVTAIVSSIIGELNVDKKNRKSKQNEHDI